MNTSGSNQCRIRCPITRDLSATWILKAFMQLPSENDPKSTELQALIRQIDERRAINDAARKELQLKAWRRLAGNHLDRMLDDPNTTTEYLSHPESNLRLAAIFILEQHFNCGNQLEAQWKKMADTDLDREVRQCAKLSLVKIYVGKNDPRATRMLAEMVKDPAANDETRVACYAYLMQVVSRSSQIDLAEIPETVDWETVNRILA